VLAATAIFIYVANSRKPRRNIWWLAGAGFCAGSAAAIDLPAAVFPLPFFLSVFAMRWPIVRRSAAAALFAAGCAAPLYLALAFNYPVAGDWKPAMLHRELILARTGSGADLASWGSVGAALAPATPPPVSDDDDLPPPVTGWGAMIRPTVRLILSVFGGHGLLSHFPVILLGALGIAGLLRRNWPGITKMLALTTALGTAAVIIAYSLGGADERGAMFANRWFMVFAPMLLFWAGAWVRQTHRPLVWTAATILLLFSIAVSLVGATDPLPRGGYNRYTAAVAAERLLSPSTSGTASRLAASDGG
jgi:hypothetical protein